MSDTDTYSASQDELVTLHCLRDTHDTKLWLINRIQPMIDFLLSMYPP